MGGASEGASFKEVVTEAMEVALGQGVLEKEVAAGTVEVARGCARGGGGGGERGKWRKWKEQDKVRVKRRGIGSMSNRTENTTSSLLASKTDYRPTI